MKKMKKLLIGLAGLSLSVGAAIGVGLNADKGAKEAKADDLVEYRFTNNYSWKFIKAYAWVSSDESQHLDWNTEGAMEECYVNEEGKQVYTVSLDSKYDRIIIHGRDYNDWYNVQTDNIEIGNNHGIYITGERTESEGNHYFYFGTYNLMSTYRLYDENELFDGEPNVYAYNQTNPTINNGEGVSMTKVLENNKNVYYVDLDVKYNAVRFSGNDKTQTVTDLHNYQTYHFVGVDSGSNSWWADLDYALSENFYKNYMHMNDYDKDGDYGSTGGNGSCEEYYPLAKAAYLAFTGDLGNQVKAKINDMHFNCLERLSEWARLNNESFTPSTGAFSLATSSHISANSNSNNGSLIAIITISAISLLAVGGYFFIRKRKEDR